MLRENDIKNVRKLFNRHHYTRAVEYGFSVSSVGTYDIAVRLCFPFWDKNGIYISIDGGRKHFTESRL